MPNRLLRHFDSMQAGPRNGCLELFSQNPLTLIDVFGKAENAIVEMVCCLTFSQQLVIQGVDFHWTKSSQGSVPPKIREEMY